MNSYTKKSLKDIFQKISSVKVFVVGDAMLDKYWYGEIERISPEAPIPVVSIQRKEVRLGGAANVALNCSALGAEVFLLTTTGKDPDGQKMMSLLNEHGINAAFCLQSKERITTAKTRVIAKNQQVIRIDEELSNDLSIKDEHHFIDVCLRAIQIEKPDILIFEDYNKGLLTENMIEKIIAHCKHVGVMTSVDPKLKNFFAYCEVDLFKPNLKEIREALKMDIEAISKLKLKELHKLIHEKLKHQISLFTLSEKGIFVQNRQDAYLIPSHIRQIADVSGAGDTVIAVASLIYFISQDSWLAAQIANLAGGLVCEQAGVVSIDKALLLAETTEKLLPAKPL